MANRLISIGLMVIVIFLMLLPNAVPAYWEHPDNTPLEPLAPHILYVSYFDDMLRIARITFFTDDKTHRSVTVNYFPMVTALLTIFILLRLLFDAILIFTGKKAEDAPGKAVIICLSLCVIVSLLSYFIYGAISVIVIMIFTLHIIALILQIMKKAAARYQVVPSVPQDYHEYQEF